ncbi:hypothetical protein [Clostridium sp. BL-8]|uniref:hypothetical protein n=1 Tax=Clostridium sp. BL-8 TaxID=349938 RepID=UPI00098BE95A|nr:hypothetical protein [Clostridium sp. BL-8]OOM69524.1 hypothetical protein CLOBL_52220 [Clostridium sp. BL-8]
MIWSLVLTAMKLFIGTIVALIPALPSMEVDLSNMILFLRKGLYFTDVSIFTFVISTIVTVEFSVFTWNVIKFVYSKIPFINIR